MRHSHRLLFSAGLCQTSETGHATRHAPSTERDAAEIQLERGRPFAEHIREGGRQADLPPASCSPEHGLHPGQGGLHEGLARLGGLLVDQAEGHARGRRRRDGGGAAAFSRVPEPGGEHRHVVGVGFR